MKLDFVCVGPQRTATSWLDKVLRHHGRILLPDVVKETFFLDRDYAKGWSWYWHKYFDSSAGSQSVFGEIAPTLFDSPESILRLYNHNPDCKIIICLRDPVDRSISLYFHYYSTSQVGKDFAKAVIKRRSIIEASKYLIYIEKWVDIFGADKVYLLPHSEIESSPDLAISKLLGFLGLDSRLVHFDRLEEKYGVAVAPKSRAAVFVFHRVARSLRFAGLHGIVNFGKRIGIKKFIYMGGAKSDSAISNEQRISLEKTFFAERQFITALNDIGSVRAADCKNLFISKLKNKNIS